MKNIFYLVLTIVLVATVALNTGDAGQENTNQSESTNKRDSVQVTSMNSTLTKGLDKVLVSLGELEKVVGDTENTEKRIAATKKLGEDWDQIEKQVEEKYPEDYENIEKSLYPLLAEAKKEYPNTANVRQLLEATTVKVEAFKRSVGKTSS
ncbi:hypothetical protein LG329_11820 [Virgibacillus necropolis]|uniref:hypothetical protein n=1 Tax=Virgibacillus necropolis TaxID=163877 RepID=UPI00384F7C78